MGLYLSVNGEKIKFDLTAHEINAYDFIYSLSNSKYAKGYEDERCLKITGNISRILEKNPDVLQSIRNWARLEYADESYYNWIKTTEAYRENIIREIIFPDAFIKDYSEQIDPSTGHGVFTIVLMQKMDKRADIIIDPFNEVFPKLSTLYNPSEIQETPQGELLGALVKIEDTPVPLSTPDDLINLTEVSFNYGNEKTVQFNSVKII